MLAVCNENLFTASLLRLPSIEVSFIAHFHLKANKCRLSLRTELLFNIPLGHSFGSTCVCTTSVLNVTNAIKL